MSDELIRDEIESLFTRSAELQDQAAELRARAAYLAAEAAELRARATSRRPGGRWGHRTLHRAGPDQMAP
jgi:hypothetical protein